MRHYVIGDVHGHYETLMRLVEKLPKDAKLVFVGDLIDRGSQSAEVVKFVREGGHLCVKGNHEELMDSFGSSFAVFVEQNEPIKTHNVWYNNGGIATLKSYGLIRLEDGKPTVTEDAKEKLAVLKDDIRWIRKLPLYIELNVEHSSGKPVLYHTHRSLQSGDFDTVMPHVQNFYGDGTLEQERTR